MAIAFAVAIDIVVVIATITVTVVLTTINSNGNTKPPSEYKVHHGLLRHPKEVRHRRGGYREAIAGPLWTERMLPDWDLCLGFPFQRDQTMRTVHIQI